MKRVLCLWLPHWSLQRLRLAPAGPEPVSAAPRLRRPSGRSDPRPLLIATPTGRRGPVVSDCSRQVLQQGVRPGMPLAEARALLERVRWESPPQFAVCDPEADLAALRKLARTCERYSPLVGLEETPPPESLLLDITGCEHLFGGEQALAEQVVRDLRQQGIRARAAAADTVGAAWAVAHGQSQSVSRRRDPAPLPVWIITPGQQEAALRPLPVSGLRLPPKVSALLEEFDLRRIGQILDLPRETLPSRFGAGLLQRLDQALGMLPEPIVPERWAEPVEGRWSSDDPLSGRRDLETVLQLLLEQLHGELTPRREGVRKLQAWLSGPAPVEVNCVVELVRPCLAPRHLLELLRLQIERHKLPAEIFQVRLQAAVTSPLTLWQPDLFGQVSTQEGERALAGLLERLSSRLGPQAVVSPQLLPEFQPELAVRYEPCVGAPALPPACSRAPGFPQRLRPLALNSAPVCVEAPSGVFGRLPRYFEWQDRPQHIVRYWGPERIATGWWRDQAICRDYYRVETSTGRCAWLFQLVDGRWYLHGWFD